MSTAHRSTPARPSPPNRINKLDKRPPTPAPPATPRWPLWLLLGVSALGALVGLPLAWLIQRLAASDVALVNAALAATVEEPIKVLAVLWVMRDRRYRFGLDGAILGVTAAMGFGTVESLSYGRPRRGNRHRHRPSHPALPHSGHHRRGCPSGRRHVRRHLHRRRRDRRPGRRG